MTVASPGERAIFERANIGWLALHFWPPARSGSLRLFQSLDFLPAPNFASSLVTHPHFFPRSPSFPVIILKRMGSSSNNIVPKRMPPRFFKFLFGCIVCLLLECQFQLVSTVKISTFFLLKVVEEQEPIVFQLEPWEHASILRLDGPWNVTADANNSHVNLLGQCTLPIHYQGDEKCCIGSLSAGGSSVYRRTYRCALGPEAVEESRLQVMDMLYHHGPLRLSSQTSQHCDACRMVDIALQHNFTIAFTGDSVQHQVWDAFVCELRKHNYHLDIVTERRDHEKGQVGVRYIETVKIQHAASFSVVLARFYAQYRPLTPENMTEIHEISQWTDILIMNFGVHWRHHEHIQYHHHMKTVFEALKQHSFALLAWRETTAQHFNNPGGEFIRIGSTCAPLATNDTLLGWRESLVQRAAQEMGYQITISDETMAYSSAPEEGHELFVLPFFNFTSSLHYLRPIGGGDCTHFCSNPFVWKPLWRSLRLALDFKYPTNITQ